MLGNKRSEDINNEYGWYLTAYRLCSNIKEFNNLLEMEMGDILNWIELSKAQEELDYIYSQKK
jgi:hypothetical protein